MTRPGEVLEPPAFRSEPARRAVAIADRFGARRSARGPAEFRSDAERAWWLRRMLEELGTHCEDSPQLSDLRGFLIASPRGLEAVVASHLDDAERLRLYAHFFAHVLVGDADGAIAVCLEYADGRAQRDRRSPQVLKQEGMADAVAAAMLHGRLERTPRYLYYRDEPVRTRGLRPGLRRRAGAVLHRISLALFRRSRRYQRLRTWSVTTLVVNRVQDVLAA